VKIGFLKEEMPHMHNNDWHWMS